MAHGTPDWGLTAGATRTYQLTDLAELAVRLGAPVIFDRRGDVIFWDSFENGLGSWNIVLVGAGGAVDLSLATRRTGWFSVRLHTDAVADDQVRLQRSVPIISLSRLGLEASFFLDADTQLFVCSFYVYDGVDVLTGQVRYNLPLERLSYLNAAGALVTLEDGLVVNIGTVAWNTVKLVVDGSAEEYVRVLFNNRSYDLAGVACQKAADASAPHLGFEVIAKTNVAASIDCYVDDLIATENEPA